ncbi:aldolase [Candidatus Dojkabacteria bacterium]|uniref:fructose-bisphosphate aldolase n=1 Tax=Candidatus Dojkabacteria bacterium TaxID=2099670 RepID=A0A955RJ66_9BACT|nr:aldolase [Candidatus Dojkabacteria bacterium]
MNSTDIKVPLDVPHHKRDTYIDNYLKATRGSGNLLLFAGDQKVEHLNGDFYGEGIAEADATPHHYFQIAQQAPVGVFAAQLGLIARHGMDYLDVPYLVKLNSKTNIVKPDQDDPYSSAWYDMSQVIEFKESTNLQIPAVGYTVYIGSEYEDKMLREAAQITYQAHKNGLLSVIWAYPRGAAIDNYTNPHLIASAAGVASALGADFVKVNCPIDNGQNPALLVKEAVLAAGNTKVVCSGGKTKEATMLLKEIFEQMHIGETSGCALGRNIHQRELRDAVRLINAIHAIVVEGKNLDQAESIYQNIKQ